MDTIWANCKNSPQMTEDCFCTKALMENAERSLTLVTIL